MKNYIVYIENTGQIVCFGTCSDIDYNFQAQEGQSIMEGIVTCDSYIENKKIIPIPKKPFSFYLFDYASKQWYDPRTNETEWNVIRNKRNNFLALSDWTQLPDVAISTKNAWATYRQALRDITNQTDPFNIIWPTSPQG
jgi:hypothetical protein